MKERHCFGGIYGCSPILHEFRLVLFDLKLVVRVLKTIAVEA